jgi:hypothetical protein
MYYIIFRSIFPNDSFGDFKRSEDGLTDIVQVQDDNTFVVQNVFKSYGIGVVIQPNGYNIHLFDEDNLLCPLKTLGYIKGNLLVTDFEAEIQRLIDFSSCAIKLNF